MKQPGGLEFLEGGGEMAALMRAYDWSATSLGPAGGWPQSLKTATAILLRSPVPIVMLWGEDGVMIYNDAYSVFAGGRHPRLLGSKVREGWPEVAAFNDNVMKVGLAGGTLAYKDQELTLFRHGRPEQVWMNLDYSPVLDESGRPAGVVCILAETTERVAADRRTAVERERQRLMLQQMPGFAGILSGPEHRYEYVNDAYIEIAGPRRFIGRTVREVFPEIAGQGFFDLLDRVYATGEPFIASAMPISLDRADGDRFIDLLYEPVRDDDGQVVGIFFGGYDVTEQVRATAALRESEARYRTLFDSVESGFCIVEVDLDGPGGRTDYRVVEANPAFYRQTGFPEAILGQWLREAAPALEEHWYEIYGGVARTGEPKRFEQGSELLGRWFDVYTFRTGEPEQRRVAILFTDISARRIVEQQLRESESRYRTLFEAIDEGFCIIEFLDGPHGPLSDYVHVQANPAYTANAGIPDIVGKRLREIVGDEADAWAETYRNVLVTGEPIRFERELVATGRHLELAAFRLEPESRQQVAVLFQDITARKRAETALRSLNETLERRVEEQIAERNQIWNLSSDPLLIADTKGVWLSASPAWTTLLGWRPDELIGRTSEWMEHPDDQSRTRTEVEHLAGGQPTLRFENRFRASDGRYHWFSWTAVPQGDRLFAVARDVTAEKERAAELEVAQEALRQSQKMEAVGQLTGGVAHDFNNLLQIVTGNLDILQRNLPSEMARLRRSADHAMIGARRAAALTHRLLAFSRRQPLDPKPISVNRLVTSMSDLLGRTLGETVEIETILSGGLWQVEADPNQLEAAVLNLAVNARDAMPDGGKLTIETSNTHLDRAYAMSNVEVTPGQYVVICVSDTGVGMESATIARAFEPFFTTKEVGRGTGLGLSQVYGFVKQSNGHVKIYSEPGEGTTVKIYLPRLMTEAAEEVSASQQIAPEGSRTETILVVEDDDDVRAYSVEVLRDLGYRVLEAHDGPSALRLLERQDSGVKLLFSDVVLPGGMTGAVVAEKARSLVPDLKVLFATGYARNAIVHQGRLDPGVHLLTKPFIYEELAARVRDILDGQR